MNILVTGGAGFIGSELIRFLINNTTHNVLNIDKLTYAGNLASLDVISSDPRYSFKKEDITNRDRIAKIFEDFQPDVIFHLAAESHVDNSIKGPLDFVNTNIVGTAVLLDVSYNYWVNCDSDKKKAFKFQHISTDEVYGSLDADCFFTENTPYDPSSPYSASKAGSDHLVRAWHKTYKLPTLITNCSNNYGPHQFPEKLIPLVVLNAIQGKSLPIYGNGLQVRDWLYVGDHVKALYSVMQNGKCGETYNVGGNNQKSNIEVVNMICDLLDERLDPATHNLVSFKELIKYVDDRPGHDIRYAIDCSKIYKELGWQPLQTFESGIKLTLDWYLENYEY